MTREEAIAYFKDMNECTYGNVEPIQMAIKALEQQPCEDCISRQDLREPRFIIAENDYQKGWNDALDSVYENAPSIQPKQKTAESDKCVYKDCYYNDGEVHAECVISEWLKQEPCEDCISREEVIDLFPDNVPFIGYNKKCIKEMVNELPSVKPTTVWHKVEDKLPEINQFVLCKCRANITEVLKFTVDGWYHDINHCYMDGFVIAWTELPEWEE